MIITAGKTNVSVYYYIVQDASATSPGEPVTGLLFSDIETGGSASYARQGAARVDLTLITLASASATHADGGFILVDDTNMPGVYRCDYPDAAFATGVDQVVLSIVVASGKNAVAAPIYLDITDVDLRDSVRGGMTALPNAAADAAGGLTISDAGGLDLDAMNTNINDIETDTADMQPRVVAIEIDTSTTLDTKINTIDTNVDEILVDTGTTIPASISALNDISVSEVLTTQMTQSYAADGTAPTLAQALFLISQSIGEFSISGTTITVKELDGSTTAATYTLDDGTDPTSRTRTT